VFIGAGDREMVKKTVYTSVLTALACGLICATIGITGARVFLVGMGTPAEVADQAVVYTRMYFAGVPAAMLYNFCAGILRADGETRRPLIYLSISGVANVVLNLIFVIFFKMGAAGVGLATAISQYLAAGMVLREMIKTNEVYKFNPKNITPSFSILKRILGVGVTSGVQGSVFSLANIVVQSSINSFGADVVAGNAAAQNIDGFVYIAMNAFCAATTTIVGQNIGARKGKRVDKVVIEGSLLVTLVGILTSFCLFFFGEELIKLYCPNSPVAMEYAKIRLVYICMPYFLCGIMEVLMGALRACGYAIHTMTISIIVCCGVRIVWLMTVFKALRTIQSIYIVFVITWVICIISFTVLYIFFAKKKLKEYNQ
jgi:putative MATE family efflux protein